MHKIRILLLALLFLCASFASATSALHTCCPLKECNVAQCIDMGCAPVAPTIAPGAAVAAFVMVPPAREHAAHLSPFLADRYEKVWTPPD
ncbi:hypothetical protein GTP46_06040 [Duganella sp. FT135W]|uniref:Uncharacterized protein n=1 Tax=Duganella flavida TaxID=2692175 RepID=A0A6L8K3W2_9BURK|nr:hypothetical protein [Duganella flavida]MYM22199.1 hypothetical protein [Duganella flavida]